MQNALAGLLKSIAGRYVKLRSSDLSVGISGGHLVVENVEVRTEALNRQLARHGAPVEVLSGRAARLRVDVPWSALSSAPVLVFVEGLYLIAGPRKGAPTREEAEASVGRVRKGRRRSGEGERRRDRSQNEESAPIDAAGDSSALGDSKWHTTLLGRLLFNVTVEVEGLTLAYEDEACRAALRLDSLMAFSAGRDWKTAFVPLDSYSRLAFVMRKRFQVSGLTLRMHERGGTKPDAPSPPPAKEVDDAEVLGPFEALWPVVDNLSLVLKVQVCCSGDQATDDALAVDIDIDIDDPMLSLSSRQLHWFVSILERSRSYVGTPSEGQENGQETVQKLSRPRRVFSPRLEQDLDHYREVFKTERETEVPRKGRLARWWNLIVGETGYEIRDDAADLLGFDRPGDSERDEQEMIEEAVALASDAGGFTMKVRLLTPDFEAREEIHRLRRKLKEEEEYRRQFQDVETVLAAAEAKVRAAVDEKDRLLQRNAALLEELHDLESLTAEASHNKDVVIRQMEAALVKAERNLQALIQRTAGEGHSRRPSISPTSSTGDGAARPPLRASSGGRRSAGDSLPGSPSKQHGSRKKKTKARKSNEQVADGLTLV